MLEKTKTSLLSKLARFFTGGLKDEFFDELEEALILSDVGTETTIHVVDTLRHRVKEQGIKTAEGAKGALVDIIARVLQPAGSNPSFHYPLLLLVVGVNGAGKTTSIGKLAHRFSKEGKKVLICAGDTFRAAAIEQLETWAGRAGVRMVKSGMGADPAATLFDAIQAAKARGCDVILCDTAGRLQNRKNLMDELHKMARVADKEFEGERRTLFILDANTGQNGISQAKEFGSVAKVDGIMLTKLDGTAKGGIALAVASELAYPVWYCGIGEKMEDMVSFDPQAFSRDMIG